MFGLTFEKHFLVIDDNLNKMKKIIFILTFFIWVLISNNTFADYSWWILKPENTTIFSDLDLSNLDYWSSNWTTTNYNLDPNNQKFKTVQLDYSSSNVNLTLTWFNYIDSIYCNWTTTSSWFLGWNLSLILNYSKISDSSLVSAWSVTYTIQNNQSNNFLVWNYINDTKLTLYLSNTTWYSWVGQYCTIKYYPVTQSTISSTPTEKYLKDIRNLFFQLLIFILSFCFFVLSYIIFRFYQFFIWKR